MKLVLLIGVLIGMVAANFIYQAARIEPEWAVAAERSWFQFVALVGVAIAWAIASINHSL